MSQQTADPSNPKVGDVFASSHISTRGTKRTILAVGQQRAFVVAEKNGEEFSVLLSDIARNYKPFVEPFPPMPDDRYVVQYVNGTIADHATLDRAKARMANTSIKTRLFKVVYVEVPSCS